MAIIVHDNQERDLVSGRTIFDYADDLKVQVPTSCGRAGICHECVVEIKQGMEALSPRGEAESFLSENYRLACQAWIENPDIDVHFSPLRRRPKILVETLLTKYVTPKYPHVDIKKPFALPWGIEKLTLEPKKAKVVF